MISTHITEKCFVSKNYDIALRLFGIGNKNLSIISEVFDISFTSDGLSTTIQGSADAVDKVFDILFELTEIIEKGGVIKHKDVQILSESVKNNKHPNFKDFYFQTILKTSKKSISPKTKNQSDYIESILNNTLTFGIGPAGTGKTFLAIVVAVSMLQNKQVSKIILTRPAVEAGEKLGFLPGDLTEKINPYLTPLFDAILELLGEEQLQSLLEDKIIEIAPLAFMRGRTLKNAFVILDEAQNTTHEQMKMFLTRMGDNTKYVVTGDITQIDLPDSKTSGLIEAMNILQNIEDINLTFFKSEDVIRHPLVRKIIDAYEKLSN